ncbi:MAG: NAD(P)-dependent oxidoreductase, partial [Rhodopila sp.]|nr:NAD(P)-dependent oxidoreductase [Rhodopila sp.]
LRLGDDPLLFQGGLMDWFGPAFRSAVAQGGLSIAVTGAGSWLGQSFLSMLAAEGLLPEPARLRLFASSSRAVQLGGRTVPVERLERAPALEGGPWLLLHFAFLGKERTEHLSTADFIAANAGILRETLRIAEPARDLRMVFSSSGAAYGRDRRLVEDPDANPYGWCKVTQEADLTAWCAARGVPLVIPRIFSIGGDWVNKTESYALSSFILAARREGVIRIMARKPVFRSFVHVAELNGLLCEAALAQAGEAALVFDTAGRETLEMADLADAVAGALRPAEIRIERAGPLEGETDYYVGEGRVYRSILARNGCRVVGIERIVADTAAFLNRA